MTKQEIGKWVKELVAEGYDYDEACDFVSQCLDEQDGYKKCNCEDYPCCGH